MCTSCSQVSGLVRLYSARNRRGASREAERTADVAAVRAHAAGGHGDLAELEDVAQHHAQRLQRAPHPRLTLRLCLCMMLVVLLSPSSVLSARSKPCIMPRALTPLLDALRHAHSMPYMCVNCVGVGAGPSPAQAPGPVWSHVCFIMLCAFL